MLAIRPHADRTMVSCGRKMNLDDMTSDSACEQNTPHTLDELGTLFHDAYTVVKNVCEGLTNIKDGSPSTPTTCLVV